MDSEKLVKITLPMLPGNREGEVRTVTINGVKTEVPIGVETKVAYNVALVLADNYGSRGAINLPEPVEEPAEEPEEEEVEKPLSKQNREELNQTAENLGVESPEEMANKEEVVEAIEEAREAAEEEEEEEGEE